MAAPEWTRDACALCSKAPAPAPASSATVAEPGASPARDELFSLRFRPAAPLKIFLSYGHDRFQQLAFHIKAALQARGHEVWVDVERLSAGVDWEEGIAGGLSWVKDAQHDGRVLLLMTPHALRRPDGYCLNEIARAASSRLAIFPVMVADSDPPPAITMLPFFDLRDCVPSDGHELALDAKSDEWSELMISRLHNARSWEKLQRLFALLELFTDMSAYGVPAVGGLDNLGLFASYDPHTDQHPHFLNEGSRSGSSTRRLLLHRSSCDSVGLVSTGEDNRSLSRGSSATDRLHSSPSSLPPSPQASSKKSSSPVYGFHRADTTEDKVIVDSVNGDNSEENDGAVTTEGHRVRYIFSFDDSCYILAKLLYDDLLAAGLQAFPPVRPTTSFHVPGDPDDQQSFADALHWASAEKCGKLILLVTPESVGRPSGSSLNDISAVMAAGLGFVPLMVRQSEIPLSICRIQWLDMTDCLLYSAKYGASGGKSGVSINAVRYQVRKDQLLNALQRGQLDHEGQQARLFSLLSPFSFQQQMSKLTHRFTGREWLFDMVRNWMSDHSTSPTNEVNEWESRAAHQVFWITGQIGAGKTAAAARMIQCFPEIAAFHFALQEHEQTQSARRCVLSLSYQLTTQLPEYAAYLQHAREPLEEIVPISSFAVLVTHLLVEPLNAIARRSSDHKPLVLLIDGLECILEASSTTNFPAPPTLSSKSTIDNSFLAMLPSLVARMPSWVRFVLLSRDTPDVRAQLQAFVPSVTIDHFANENTHDIEAYIASSLLPEGKGTGLPDVATASKGQYSPVISSDQIALIAQRAEGLFLYAVNVVNAVEEGRLALHELDALPTGMGGSLRQVFDRHFASQSDDEHQQEQKYKTHLRPVLEVLCAAYEPLTVRAIGNILGWDAYKRREVINSFGSLFYIADLNGEESSSGNEIVSIDGEINANGVLRPFHSSVVEWVQDARSAGPYYVDSANGHERLGQWAWREYEARVRAKPNEFITLNYALEGANRASSDDRMLVYIVRHACNHLMKAPSIDCMHLLARFASDESFQHAREILSVRTEGLGSFFHGDIDRDRAQQLLLQYQPGQRYQQGRFLIRFSAKQDCYCASFIESVDPQTGRPTFRHNLIYHHKSGAYSGAYSVVPPEKVKDSTLVFPDLVSFVEEYQRKGVLRVAVPRQTALNREISEVAEVEKVVGN